MMIQTDCNQINAKYVLGGGGAMTITPSTTTLAACPDDSVAEDFINWLAAANSFQGGKVGLVIYVDPESDVLGLVFAPP